MKERPILFNGEMVRAILDGRKTQTRRPICRIVDKVRGGKITEFGVSDTKGYEYQFRDKYALWNDVSQEWIVQRNPLGNVGDRLWVRETWIPFDDPDLGICIKYRADNGKKKPATWTEKQGWKCHEECFSMDYGAWHPSIHMPRFAARIVLEIEDVRAQRIYDISEEDAIAEGIWFDGTYYRSVKHPVKGTDKCWPSARDAFFALWDSIYGKGEHRVEANPWVFAYTLKRL